MPQQEERGSEIARLLQQIQAAYESASLGCVGLASGAATHKFITVRMERMGQLHRELERLVGEEEAISLFVEALEGGS